MASTIFTDPKVLLLVSTVLGLVVIRRIQRVRHIWQAPGDSQPAYFIFVSPTSIFGRLLPRIPWFSPGVSFIWKDAYRRQPLLRIMVFSTLLTVQCLGIFTASKSDVVQIRSLFPDSTPQLLLADAAAAKVRLISIPPKWGWGVNLTTLTVFV